MKGFGNAGQWLGLVMVVVAIVFLTVREKGVDAEVIVASGSFMFAVATKVKYYRDKGKRRQFVRMSELTWSSKGLHYGKGKR